MRVGCSTTEAEERLRIERGDMVCEAEWFGWLGVGCGSECAEWRGRKDGGEFEVYADR